MHMPVCVCFFMYVYCALTRINYEDIQSVNVFVVCVFVGEWIYTPNCVSRFVGLVCT